MKADMLGWKITGIIATVVIILSIPLYLVKERRFPLEDTKKGLQVAAFAGSEKCKDCHQQEYTRWKGSHHERAMDVATADTVLGDFDGAVFEHFGVTSRFYRQAGKFYVQTQGPQGLPGEFEITHTFGWYPLQQYLVPFDGGRLQCLPLAWDVREKRWYHLYPDHPLDPDDWLYWTNAGQTWNGMCAECHSTDLKKNYDMDTHSYRTTWSEISVGCEACHGPALEHVKWAELPDMGRPEVNNFALTVQTRGLTSRRQIELCAPCHARRMSLDDNIHRHADFLDYGIPQLLTQGYYFADGQILEEVYVYGSFMQSKMYDRGVRCSDCHEVHSIKRIKSGNDLCLQCHKQAVYDSAEHHFHKRKNEAGEPVKSKTGTVLFEVGSGAECEQCHMPGRLYMGVDYRPDHSFRLPRPDLSAVIGAPNACNRCHWDKTNAWSADTLLKWYGKRRRAHYGTILAVGRNGKPEAETDLAQLVQDRLYPAIVRATALALLATYPGAESRRICEHTLADEEALLRHTAVQCLDEPDPWQRLKLVGPLLYDAVKGVRIEAARSLVGVPPERMPPEIALKYNDGLDEYRRAMERTADFAASRHNLGNLEADLGHVQQAMEHYRRAIAIDAQFYPAKVNLAMLYNRQGQNGGAEKLLREVVTAHPELYEIAYSLGLLLAEMQKYDEAVAYLAAAGKGLPSRARIHYNLGLLLQQLQRSAEAETALKRALAIEPGNHDYLWALADFYLRQGRLAEARTIAQKMRALYPGEAAGRQILELIDRLASQSAQ
jgi:tetratricopeptide (TPR) repeat protein